MLVSDPYDSANARGDAVQAQTNEHRADAGICFEVHGRRQRAVVDKGIILADLRRNAGVETKKP